MKAVIVTLTVQVQFGVLDETTGEIVQHVQPVNIRVPRVSDLPKAQGVVREQLEKFAATLPQEKQDAGQTAAFQ